MPSSLSTGDTARPLKGPAGFRAGRVVPDFIVPVHVTAAATFTGANTGSCAFTVPTGCKAVFLGAVETHQVAGNNPFRVKKVVSGNTSDPGAAADANNIDLSAAIATSGAANTPQQIVPLAAAAPAGYAVLNAGDRLCVASALANTGLAGCSINLRLAWI